MKTTGEFVVWLLCEKSVVAFMIVTVTLGGGAAFLAGRAAARSWKPFRNVMFFMILLAVAVRFLHWGLFVDATLPSWREMQGTFFVGTAPDWAFSQRSKPDLAVFSDGQAATGEKSVVSQPGVQGDTSISSAPRYYLRLHYYLVDVLILIGAAALGYRLERARQMTTQYRWLYVRTGLLSWKERS